MKIVKMQYSVDNLLSLKLLHSFSEIKFIEVLDIFHYNRLNFYTLKRITFKNSYIDYRKIINEVFQPSSFQILEMNKNIILCIMTLKRDNGFWPKILSGSWVISPPIIIDEEFITISIIVKDNFKDIYKKWSKIIDKINILSIKTIKDNPDDLDLKTRQILRNTQPYPYFPAKQHEISSYATRKGYYNFPRKISAEELAKHFNISVTAINEHLRKAERTSMHYFFL